MVSGVGKVTIRVKSAFFELTNSMELSTTREATSC
jgi:hypothetical protein